MPIPVAVVANLEDRRLPEPMEASLYFFVSEALANVVKHARAAHAEIRLCIDGEDLVVDVCDDGVGGAAPGGGTGLAGLADRIAALDRPARLTRS
jgi:signal transduction histidine kinase